MSNTSLQPLTLYPWVYVLRCKPRAGTDYPSFYAGATLNCHQRITQHFTGCGARFTQAHPPIAVEALYVDVGDSDETVLQREQRITLELMRRHIAEHGEEAWRSVAGGGYSSRLSHHSPRAATATDCGQDHARHTKVGSRHAFVL